MKDFIIPDRDFGTPAAKSKQMVTLTIDGFDVTVPEGTSIMRAAAEIGIPVPKLCATDSVDAFGSCRLCLVEIEGRAGTPGSCTTPVAPGIKVQTQTGKLKQLRKRRDGALHLGPPAGLPDLCGQRRLRVAGHGRRRRPARRAL
jgi:formate dehydrogenase major subunit